MAVLYYLGPEGTHSHVAALTIAKFLDGSATQSAFQLQSALTIAQVIENVVKSENAFGCIPLENSIQGSVTMAWDSLLTHTDQVQLHASWTIPIDHFLLTLPGARVADLHTVYSHPQALAQCKNWLASHAPQATFREVSSTAASAAEVSQMSDAGSAAIGSRTLADAYGLEASSAPIQDIHGNVTRFGIISSSVLDEKVGGVAALKAVETERVSRWTLSICLRGVGNQPGGLVAALIPFREHGLNLSRIESRPVGDALGVYVFYLDVSTHLPPVSLEFVQKWTDTLAQLSSLGIDVVRLGVYPNLKISL